MNMETDHIHDETESVAGFSGFTKEDLSKEQPPRAPTSEVPKPVNKKRGRPRKVAAEGEDKRRKQMIVRKKRKDKSDTSKTSEGSIQGIPTSKYRFPSDLVNTTKVYLPDGGWKCLAIKRSSGINKGFYDVIYLAPDGSKIRSRRDVYMWAKKNNSDINPLRFLFSRSEEILHSEENSKLIHFRKAGIRNHAKIYIHEYVPNRPPRKYKSKECNTIISERGRELLLNDESSSSLIQSFEGSKEGTPRKKQSAKPRRVPSDVTLQCLESPYFTLKNQIPTKPVSIHAIHHSKWIPPRSPYNLIQEDLYHDPWQLLIATIFLNCTTGKLAIPIIHEFLARWPGPHEACSASLFDIVDVIELLGLGRSRAATIIRFSHEFLTLDWKKPSELFGIGKYGYDSYKVFCLGLWKSVESEDKFLNLYVNWLHNTCSKAPTASRLSESTALVPKRD